MAGKSPIEWTEHTWNPIVGCSLKSPGCKNCYAMPMARRLELMGNAAHYVGLTDVVKGKAVFNGTVRLAPDHILLEPLKRKKPTTYFVNSMGDLHHENVRREWIDKVAAVMFRTPQHTYQVLTKRAQGMRDYWSDPDMPARVGNAVATMCPGKAVAEAVAIDIRDMGFPNVWLGVSTERQQEADERIPLLLQTPAAIRFISAEPLLGPIELDNRPRGSTGRVDYLLGRLVTGGSTKPIPRLDWVIVGGESGPDARPMHPEWARGLRDQCAAAGVPFFFKQWGSWWPAEQAGPPELRGTPHEDDRFVHMGKKAAGRKLDGKEHNGFPVTRTEAAA